MLVQLSISVKFCPLLFHLGDTALHLIVVIIIFCCSHEPQHRDHYLTSEYYVRSENRPKSPENGKSRIFILAPEKAEPTIVSKSQDMVKIDSNVQPLSSMLLICHFISQAKRNNR